MPIKKNTSLNTNLYMIIYSKIFNNIYVIDFKGNVGFLLGHSVTMTGWIPKLPKFFHEINIYILKTKQKTPQKTKTKTVYWIPKWHKTGKRHAGI